VTRGVFSLRARGILGVVLDIEGTTTPISYVYDVLFPYARAHIRAFLEEHLDSATLDEALRLLRDEWEGDVARGLNPPDMKDLDRDARLTCLVRYAEWLMDRDRKSSGLKLLQGRIWEGGYADGTLHGQVFPDVPMAMERWHSYGISVSIYSSGSVLAQRLLFGSTPYGDLTRFIGHYFDTEVGPKKDTESYRRIGSALKREPAELLFISDVAAELDAAANAGLVTLLCIRPGNNAEIGVRQEVIRSFDEIEVELTADG
jgi:enolase-phosphatase E1